MDSVVYAALEEICSLGANGLLLQNLWLKLLSPLSSHGPQLCPNVKKALWSNLITIPGLQFERQGATYNRQDPLFQSLEECELLNVKIIAPEHLRNSFVGIYDIKASDAGISQQQRRVLERLAIARTNGITQSELAKEFGMKGNNIFYILRNLECRGLILRQATIVRRKEASIDGEPKANSVVTTNMLHLFRYAKHMGCQQRLEITKEDKTLVDCQNVDKIATSCDGVSQDVHVKDYLPGLKAVCDKLEQADGKVLLVADIKRDLTYRGSSGHKAWRNEVSCLRLLKKFFAKNFEPRALGCGHNDLETEQSLRLGKSDEQLVELPIEHQIYDMIDAEGSKGLTIIEEEEKFLIKAELHRQLESLEKEKHTMMDRKTLDLCLNKLQKEGHCKCIRVSVPVITNYGHSRIMDVVLHPSLLDVSPELLSQIHERLRSFEVRIQNQSLRQVKNIESAPVSNGVQRILKDEKSVAQCERSEAMRANGFVLAKMVRTKLLHIHPWVHLSSSPVWNDGLSSGKRGYDLKNPHSTCILFDPDAAFKAMPLELFLQVVGSNQKFDDMLDKCKKGLCLSDLPMQEFKHLMDTRAMGRLSWLIDILLRLKLIRLVCGGHSDDVANVPHATLTHALELKPFIEEPVSVVVPSSDLCPQVRHDFVLSSRKAVDEYWNMLSIAMLLQIQKQLSMHFLDLLFMRYFSPAHGPQSML